MLRLVQALLWLRRGGLLACSAFVGHILCRSDSIVATLRLIQAVLYHTTYQYLVRKSLPGMYIPASARTYVSHVYVCIFMYMGHRCSFDRCDEESKVKL